MRRIPENCFVIIANRWRVFRAPILLPLDTVVDLILVALVLHNFLRVNGMTDQEDEEGNVIPGPWRCNSSEPSSWFDYHPQCSNNYSTEAWAIREEYMDYFMKEGVVPWQ